MRIFKLSIIFFLINFSLCNGQEFYELTLDSSVFSIDTVVNNDIVEINYSNKIRKSSFRIQFKIDSVYLPHGDCIYKDSVGNVVTGQYDSANMVGKWIEKNNCGNIMRTVDYDFNFIEIPEDSLYSGELARDTIDPHFFVVEHIPSFLGGGTDRFRQYISKNIFIPPSFKFFNLENERVFVEFIVNVDGKVVNVKIVRGRNKDLNVESLRVINSSPKWNNSRPRGKLYAVKFVFPILFGNP